MREQNESRKLRWIYIMRIIQKGAGNLKPQYNQVETTKLFVTYLSIFNSFSDLKLVLDLIF